MDNELGTVKVGLQTLTDEVSQVKVDVRQLKVDVRELKDDVRQLKVDVRELKDDVRQLKSTLGDVGIRLERMEKVRVNATKSRPWETIEKIGRFARGNVYEEPTYFPRNAGEFWKLKHNRTGKNSEY